MILTNFREKNSSINSIKLTQDEIQYLKSKVNEIYKVKSERFNFRYVGIPEENFQKISKFLQINIKKDPLIEFIQKKIDESPERRNISCRKLANKYKEEKGISINKKN